MLPEHSISSACHEMVKIIDFVDFVDYKRGRDGRPASFDEKRSEHVEIFVKQIFPRNQSEILPLDTDLEGKPYLKNSWHLYLSFVDDDLSGFISVKEMLYNDATIKIAGRASIPDGQRYNLYLIGVDTRFRRMGLASKLIQFVLDEFCKKKCIFEVYARSRNVAALEMYKKLGFSRISVVKSYYSDNGDDAIVFAWYKR